jgi:hypothetical protein
VFNDAGIDPHRRRNLGGPNRCTSDVVVTTPVDTLHDSSPGLAPRHSTDARLLRNRIVWPARCLVTHRGIGRGYVYSGPYRLYRSMRGGRADRIESNGGTHVARIVVMNHVTLDGVMQGTGPSERGHSRRVCAWWLGSPVRVI